MSIEIKEVKTKRELRQFIQLPAMIHRGHKNWVPPIYLDDRTFFNAKRNYSFSYSDTILLLALKNNKPVGRIMGIVNHEYNRPNNLKEGRFCFFECFNDYDVAEKLINTVELWAFNLGMDSVVGPLGFSDKDPQGFLVEGFDEPVVLQTNCNFPYMVEFIERLGYTKKIDLVVYKMVIPEQIPEFYKKINERVSAAKSHLRLVGFETRKQMKSYVRPCLRLVNETFTDIYAFSQLTEKEMDEFANRFLFLLDPHFLKVIENENKEVIAFILGMRDMSVGLRKCRGRLLPFGILQVLFWQRRTRQLNLILGAIHPDYRNIGIDTILGVNILEQARKAGLKVLDSHLELETNLKMRAEMEKMGGSVYKRFRIFKKNLVDTGI